jgi:mannose-1-phosphate guanylyltransferase
MIPALVLTAGLGTRLRPLSLVRAKAAMPVGGDVLVGIILKELAEAGVRDAVLNLHHLPASITARIGDGTTCGLRVRYSWETSVLGSAGGPRRALSLMGSPTFAIVNGDTLSSVDLEALVEDHRRSGALVTMAVVPNVEPQKYRGIAADSSGRVLGFVDRGSSRPSFHFVGVQVVEAAAFENVPPDTVYESVAQLYPSLLNAHPGAIRVFAAGDSFDDIGTPADYMATALRYASRSQPGASAASAHGSDAAIDPTASIEHSVLWDAVTVGAHATLHDCIVTDGVRVPAGSSWTGMTLRAAIGAACPGERREGGLYVGPIADADPGGSHP